MGRLRVHNFTISLDGFGTGEGQAPGAPFGHAGERLHDWMFATRYWHDMVGGDEGSVGADHAFAAMHGRGIGAEIMGAGKFGPPGWQDDPGYKGAWGSSPPFHTPVFVLTHRPRPSIEMEGGTTFHFLDASPAQTLERAREAAGGLDVRLGGGVSVIRDFLAEGLVDQMHVVQIPILLGRGVRLWDGLESLEEAYAIEAVSTPSGVTHLTFTARTR
ncbi:dihydrofolate reductase [Nonomuraea sp. KC401]|uniref:dihydrofolate reductase family protein n=1 Tax=unclassified Nonomuraea TaxID=2593643 RepID=UPI0010FE4441|nr:MULTISPECIES: dihydrofolate reductase family protein [unclassified Nonomuraea]NBE93580.1 dihydrofolate reductase [Nonomuraea sp. K271]TLF79992.1 dihydrofolate reductase [Nonomuraea sp. KC401]